MAHKWCYTKSSIKHQPQKTKGFHALKVPDQLACPLELKNNSAVLSLTIVHEKVSLTCSFAVRTEKILKLKLNKILVKVKKVKKTKEK